MHKQTYIYIIAKFYKGLSNFVVESLLINLQLILVIVGQLYNLMPFILLFNNF
jgi:hypothetical protein